MTDLQIEIICENFEQMKIINNTIYAPEQKEEYYIIPLNKSFTLESDDEIMKLTFENQLLWLKYSNSNCEIHLNEFEFNECIIIKSAQILDIYVKINTTNYLRKNVWQSQNSISLNKKYVNKYVIILPIIEQMINVFEYGEGIRNYQIELISNEILLREVKNRGNNNGYIILPNNIVQSDEAVFIMLNDGEIEKFIE